MSSRTPRVSPARLRPPHPRPVAIRPLHVPTSHKSHGKEAPLKHKGLSVHPEQSQPRWAAAQCWVPPPSRSPPAPQGWELPLPSSLSKIGGGHQAPGTRGHLGVHPSREKQQLDKQSTSVHTGTIHPLLPARFSAAPGMPQVPHWHRSHSGAALKLLEQDKAAAQHCPYTRLSFHCFRPPASSLATSITAKIEFIKAKERAEASGSPKN